MYIENRLATDSRYTFQWIVTPSGYVLDRLPNNNDAKFLNHQLPKACRRLAALQLWSSSREAMGQEYQCSDQSTRCTSPTCACTGGNGTNMGHPSSQHNYWKAGCCCDCICLQENTARKRKILKSMCSALHERGMEEERRELELFSPVHRHLVHLLNHHQICVM
jgi:hypothetical protein